MGSHRSTSRGLFITLEGGEGSGKTTQAARLAQWFTQQGRKVLHTREPGGTPYAEQIRTLLLARSTESIAPETEAFLILAARRQHVDQIIKPALTRGLVVICDRFSDSTMAYQGYGRGLDLKALRTMNTWATNNLVPDLTLFFDVPVTVGLRRRRGQASTQNRLDRETERFHRKVRAGFQTLAQREPRRLMMIDATPDPDAVEQAMTELVMTWLNSHRVRRRRR